MAHVGFQITIDYIMGGDDSGVSAYSPDNSGDGMLYYPGNDGEPIIIYRTIITIDKLNNITTVNTGLFNDKTVGPFDDINVFGINVNNNINNSSLVSSSISLTISDKYFIESPLMQLFRKGDLLKISCFPSENRSSMQSLFSGQISSINTTFDESGVDIDISIESMTTVLQNSMAVQFKVNRNSPNFKVNTLTSDVYKLGEFMNKIVGETAIPRSEGFNVRYFLGLTDTGKFSDIEFEDIAASDVDFNKQISKDKNEDNSGKGTALCKDSNIFIYVNPTSSKLDCILSAIYPYQRVLYCNADGNLIFSPLCTWLDKEWELDIMGTSNSKTFIPMLSYSKSDKLMPTNRTFMPYDSTYAIFNESGTPAAPKKGTSPQSVSLPSDYFKRDSEIAYSAIGTRTKMMVNSISALNVQNSGVWNILNNISTGKLKGLRTKIVTNENKETATHHSEQSDKFYAFSSVYTANDLAVSLFQNEQWTVKIPLVSTLNNLNEFKKIPLNRTIMVGKERLFVYAFNISWGSSGTILTLNLCRPYTIRSFWTDKVTELNRPYDPKDEVNPWKEDIFDDLMGDFVV